MTHLSIATASVPGDLLGKLDAIAEAGFDGIELHELDLIGFSGTAEDVGAHAKNLGLTVDAFYTQDDFGGFEELERDAALAQFEQKLAIMADLCTKTLILNVTNADDASVDREKLVADLAELAHRAGKVGCRAALLALPWATSIRRETEAFELIEAVGSSHLGLALNSLHSLADGSTAARLRDLPGERIFHVQLYDAPSRDFDLISSKGQFGLLPGQGGLNLASFVRVLARLGYSGPWFLGHVGSTAANTRETFVRDGYRAIVSLLDEIARTELTVEPPLDDLPDRVHATGFEFIEFAADVADHRLLTDTLSALAFRKERIHRSKAVELWRQGAVNIVVNSEDKGFAAEARHDHGPCVCDMGLRVTDATKTAKRARMLGAPTFSQRLGADELDIPAIKGVGGSVVHFIDQKSDLHRVWDIEFDPAPRTDAVQYVPQPAGVRRIDHVAQTMRYQEMQSWLTYYLSTFQMEKADIVDVVDPSGLVLSQALSSPEGEVRLNINGAGERRTFAGAFLSKAFGAGVQHIAFASDNIFETSLHLEQAGFKRLAIPQNYYDDIRTRFKLSDDMLSAMRAGNILYDRDGRGEYFQIYSAAFWGGFFFEIVERRGGYDGYGARNAPIRLAAQMHHSRETEAA